MKLLKRLFPGLKGRIRLIFISIFTVTAVIFCLLVYLTLSADLERIASEKKQHLYIQQDDVSAENIPELYTEPLTRHDIDSIIQRTMLVVIIALIIGITGVSAMIGVIFSPILRPVKNILEAGNAVAEGDLTKKLEIESDDEIGEIAMQLDMIITNFSILIQDIKHTSSVLQNSVQDLSTSSVQVAATSSEQAASVREIVTTMEDVDRLSKEIHQKIEEVNRVAIDTRETVTNGFTLINESLSKMKEIREANSDSIKGMRLLADKIDNIWEIVNIINSIADQTKIIAFNAELEAAAAGDAGKNFQIVAAEIRRLADNTVSSTSEIKQRITEIQHSSDRLIIASEEGTGKINSGLKISEDLNNRFEKIQSSAQISARSAKQIAQSISHQVGAFEQILQTLKQISAGIDSFADSAKSMTGSAENLNMQAGHLNMVVNEFRIEGETDNE